MRDVIQLASALRVLSRDVSLHSFVWRIPNGQFQLHFSLVTLFHGDNTFTQALEDSPPDPEDNSALQHILLSNDIWISTRSLRSQQIGEVHSLPFPLSFTDSWLVYGQSCTWTSLTPSYSSNHLHAYDPIQTGRDWTQNMDKGNSERILVVMGCIYEVFAATAAKPNGTHAN